MSFLERLFGKKKEERKTKCTHIWKNLKPKVYNYSGMLLGSSGIYRSPDYELVGKVTAIRYSRRKCVLCGKKEDHELSAYKRKGKKGWILYQVHGDAFREIVSKDGKWEPMSSPYEPGKDVPEERWPSLPYGEPSETRNY